MSGPVARHRVEPAPRRILVVKLADIGDVLTATPALRALRRTYPGTRIDILVTPNSAPALHGSALVDRLIQFDKFQFDRALDALRPAALLASARLAWRLFRARYDCVIVLHHLTRRFGQLKYAALVLSTGARVRAGLDNGRGWFYNRRALDRGFGVQHEVEYWLDVATLVGAHTDDVSLDAPWEPAAEEWADGLISKWRSEAGVQHYVVIHPGSGGYSLARRWPVERFAWVALAFRDQNALGIVVVGSDSDGAGELADRISGPVLNLSERTTLPQLAAILRRAGLFVGADSGVMHMAAAAGSPVVAIFGPSNASAWGPWTAGRSPSIVVRADTDCQPCSYVGFQVGQREGCATRECMSAVTPEMVLDAAHMLLSGASKDGIP